MTGYQIVSYQVRRIKDRQDNDKIYFNRLGLQEWGREGERGGLGVWAAVPEMGSSKIKITMGSSS